MCMSALIPFGVVKRGMMQVPHPHCDDQPSVGSLLHGRHSPTTGTAAVPQQREKCSSQAVSQLPSLTDCLLGTLASWQRPEQPTGCTSVSKTGKNRKAGSRASSLMVSSFCFSEADNVTLSACVRHSLKGWLPELLLFHSCPSMITDRDHDPKRGRVP